MTTPIRQFESEILEDVAERLALVPRQHLEPTIRGIKSGFIGELLERWPNTSSEELLDSAERFVASVRTRAGEISRAASNFAGRA